jgi:DNA-binding NarL/FixJ family response regulator
VITTFIVTNVRLYRDGLAAALGSRPELRIVGCGAFNDECFDRLHELTPDVVIIGYPGRDREPAMKAWVMRLPESRFVVIGSTDSEAEILGCAELGVSGIVPLDASLEELVLTVRSASSGGFRCSPQATAALARRVASGAWPNQGRGPSAVSLTRRERQIAALIEQGYSNKAIARTLDIQLSTVKNHVHKILDKLNVASRAQAAARLRHAGSLHVSATGPF